MRKTYKTVPKIRALFDFPDIYPALTAPYVLVGNNAAAATNTAGQ